MHSIPNSVLHVIAGLVSLEDLEILSKNNLKVLILGYKQVRRGKDLYNTYMHNTIDYRIDALKNNIRNILDNKWFSVVSFDNLAIKQLDIKNILSEDQWNEFYMGDDGQDGEQTSASMFVDMVERKFAKNSCASNEERYDILDTVEDMYDFLKMHS